MLHPYVDLVTTIAKDYDLGSRLVNAVAWQESSFHANAYRYEPGFWRRYLSDDPRYRDKVPERVSASYGLMQVMYSTAREHGFFGEPEFLFVPSVGLHYGCTHLKHLVNWASSNHAANVDPTMLALAAYNGGQGSPNFVYATQVAKKIAHLKNNGY